jgi:hypothetical protein
MDEYSGRSIQSIGQKPGCISNKVFPANEYFQYFWFIRQTSTSNIFHAKTRRREDARKEKEENGGSEQGAGRRLSLWSAPRFPLLPTQLLGNAFNLLPLLRKLSVIGSFHLPELHVVQRKLLV